MTDTHTIRLNGPWEMIAGLGEEAQRVKLPQGWPAVIAASRSGGVLLQRWFHRPTGLDETSDVRLVLVDLPFAGSVSVNDTRVGSFAAGEEHQVSVGAHLEARSCLTISVDRLAELGESIKTPQVLLTISERP